MKKMRITYGSRPLWFFLPTHKLPTHKKPQRRLPFFVMRKEIIDDL